MQRRFNVLVPLLCAGLAIALAACSSSDNPTTPPAGDTQAPQVLGNSPSNGQVAVAVDDSVFVLFSEAMDQSTAAGNVTLSAGTVTGMAWYSDRLLVVGHDDWAEGAQVTATVGTGLKDLAGNALAAASTFSFWTESTALTVLSVTPAEGSGDVLRDASVVVQFSRDVDTTSLQSHVTLTDQLVKATFPYDVTHLETGRYLLKPQALLPASTQVYVAITAGLAVPGGAVTLAENHITSFTTGTTTDTTPPTLVSAEPAVGATGVAVNQGFMRLTFSEPLDPDTVDLARVNLEFYILLMQNPYSDLFWNQDNTELTIPLPATLPAGLPMYLELTGATDLAGNPMVGNIVWSATVAGTADYMPWEDGARYQEHHSRETGTIGNPTPTGSDDYTDYLQIERVNDSDVRFVGYDASFTTATGSWMQYRRTANAIQWVGFDNNNKALAPDKAMFDAPLTYLPLPLAAGTWTSNTTVTVPGEGSYSAQLNGRVLPQQAETTLPGEGSQFFLKNAWRVVQTMEVSLDGTPAFTQTDTLTLAATLGLLVDHQTNIDYGNNRWDDDYAERFPLLEGLKAELPTRLSTVIRRR